MPPGPVFVPVKLQWKTASQALRPPCGVLRSSLSNVTVMSGKSCMNPPAISAIAARPTAGVPSLTLSEPLPAKNAATFSGFRLHHASAYRFANLVNSVSVILIAESAHEQIKLAHIHTSFAIVLPSQLEKRESIFVSGKATIHRLVQIDEAASNHEHGHHRLWRVLGDYQRVSLPGGFEDVSSRLCNPVMLKVSPVTAHRIAMNGANVIVSAQLGAGETFQNDAESSRRDVKAARLDPYPFRIRNPETVIFQISVGNEVFAAPSTRVEAVGKTAKGIDRHSARSLGLII